MVRRFIYLVAERKIISSDSKNPMNSMAFCDAFIREADVSVK
jgi:hypothetical protein